MPQSDGTNPAMQSSLTFFDKRALGMALPVAAPAPVACDAAVDLGYALAKQVPLLDTDFSIPTAYGDLHVPAGPLARRIQVAVRHALRQQLAALEGQA